MLLRNGISNLKKKDLSVVFGVQIKTEKLSYNCNLIRNIPMFVSQFKVYITRSSGS